MFTMPPRKRNKTGKIAQKKHITMRLMAISLKVDKYIYKNKVITVPQAQMYLDEVASIKSLCLGDARSLQVCEKLTRCMKGIIEEQQTNDLIHGQSSDVLEDTETFMDSHHSNNLHSASPVYSLADDDLTQMDEEIPIPNNIQVETNYGDYDKDVTHKEINVGSKKTVRFCINDETNAEHAYEQAVLVAPNNLINTDSIEDNNSRNLTNDVDNELTEVIVDLTLDDTQQVTEDLCSQSILKNMNVTETSNSFNQDFVHDTCGQDMAEFDREIINLIEPEAQNNEHTQCTVSHEINTSTQKHFEITKKTLHGKLPKTAETFENLKTNVVTIQLSKPVKEQRKKISKKKKDKKNKPKTRRKMSKTNTNTTKPFKVVRDSALASHPEVAFQVTHKANKEFNINKTIDSNIKENREINFVGDVNKNFATPGSKDYFNINQIVGSNIYNNDMRNNNSNVLTKKLPSIVCIEDLSWVENLTYVREIHLDEYDATLKPYSESFWDNCELPDNWDGRDFD